MKRATRYRGKNQLKRKGKSIMKRLGMLVLCIGVPLVGATLIAAWGQSSGEGTSTKPVMVDGRKLPDCPVGGQPINLAVSTATDDGPVFFCCRNCIKKFEADAKKYSEKLTDQRKALATLAQVQVTCPVSGEAVKSDVFLEEKGSKTYFCCSNCRGKYEKEPAKYAVKLANSFAYQTKCPVTGKAIDPRVSATAQAGETVFFCCKDCPGKFQKDVERFAPKLEEQGFRLDLSRKKP